MTLQPDVSDQRSQTGATLLVSLVILVLLALLGTTALKRSALQEQMTGNYYQKVVTFQASEGAVDSTINDLSILKEAMQKEGERVKRFVQSSEGLVNSSVIYSYLGTGPARGWSLDSNGTGVSRFIIASEGSIPATSARTSIEQGYVRVNPPSGQ